MSDSIPAAVDLILGRDSILVPDPCSMDGDLPFILIPAAIDRLELLRQEYPVPDCQQRHRFEDRPGMLLPQA